MKTKTIKQALLLLSFIVISQLAAKAQDVSRYIEVYKGQRGLTIYVTRYGAFEKNQALVRVSGFDHSWSEKIFLCNTTFSGADLTVKYITKINDKDWELMRTTGEKGTVWLKDNYTFSIEYVNTNVDNMEGRNDLVNDYNNSSVKGNPK